MAEFGSEVVRCDTLNVSQAATIPASTVVDSYIDSGADIAANKQEITLRWIALAQAHGTASTDERRCVHNVLGVTASLISVRAGVLVAAAGNSTVTVDVYKNGSTVLSSVITLNSSTVIRTETSGTLSTSPTSLAVGDCLEVVIDATVGTGTLPQGVYVQLDMTEKYA